MSLTCYIGPEGNILELDANQCNRIRLPSPILSIPDLSALVSMSSSFPGWHVATIDITYPKSEGVSGYLDALDRICEEVSRAIETGHRIAVLSDRAIGPDRVAISSLVAGAGVHHHLVRNKMRSRIALIIETGEAKEVHHFCVLLGYGADASKKHKDGERR